MFGGVFGYVCICLCVIRWPCPLVALRLDTTTQGPISLDLLSNRELVTYSRIARHALSQKMTRLRLIGLREHDVEDLASGDVQVDGSRG